ncbi:MAG: hypothetical protein P8Y24_08180 [Gammaproteobacteria bacterium]
MKTLTIYVNEEAVYEYDRDTHLEESQLAFLDKMDRDMGRGIKVKGELIANPDKKQRANFVVMNLIKAMKQDNDAIISVSCAYLANRIPALVEVHANKNNDAMNIDLIEEH